MKGLSKFDFGSFYGDDRFFAVSKQRYTREQAIAVFERECDSPAVYVVKDAAVRWRAGINCNGEADVGWWLEYGYDGTEPRYCPVWAFEY